MALFDYSTVQSLVLTRLALGARRSALGFRRVGQRIEERAQALSREAQPAVKVLRLDPFRLKQAQELVAADAQEGGGLAGGHRKGLNVRHGVMTHKEREAILRERFR
jgi:hypothetical protein